MNLALLAELLTILLWALGYIFIAYLNLFLDNYTQNFFRFTSAGLVLLIISLIFNREKYLFSFKSLRKLLVPTIIVFLFQIFNVFGIALTTPTIATLVTRLSVIFVDIFSFFIFPDEKAVLRDRNFLIGSAIALIGTSGVILSSSSLFPVGGSGNMLLLGGFSLIVTSVLWAGYIVSTKILLEKVDPLSATTNVFVISGLMYLPLSVISNGIYQITDVSWMVIFYLIVSGILSVGIGNLLNNYAIQRLGASLSTNLQLLVPVFTGILSLAIFGEPMPPMKLFFSLVALSGCWLILRTTTQENSGRAQGK